jgi:hypothetical protein
MADEEASYEVGYGKPPRVSRFRKGVSGNPKGRPRGSRNLASVVLRESRKKVAINDSRGRREVTKLEAVLMQLANKSAQGDLRATREFIPLVEKSEDSAMTGSDPLTFNELDQKMLEGLKKRFSSSQSETTKPTEENPS